MGEIVKIENSIQSKIDENLDLIRKTIAGELSQNEFEMFIAVCKQTGLNPIMRQVYAVKRAGKITYQTSIDGFRLIADRTGKYAGSPEPQFGPPVAGRFPEWASISVRKIVDGRVYEVGAIAYWDEYKQEYSGKLNNMWAKMPRTMLAKCAESSALRKAFPAELSGIYTSEEMSQADDKQEPEIKNINTGDPRDYKQTVAEIAKMIKDMNLSETEKVKYREIMKNEYPSLEKVHAELSDRYEMWKVSKEDAEAAQ